MGVATQSRDLLLAEEETLMFIWTLTFLTLALIAAVLGFTDFAGTGSPLARLLFVSFLFGSVVSLITGRHGASV